MEKKSNAAIKIRKRYWKKDRKNTFKPFFTMDYGKGGRKIIWILKICGMSY